MKGMAVFSIMVVASCGGGAATSDPPKSSNDVSFAPSGNGQQPAAADSAPAAAPAAPASRFKRYTSAGGGFDVLLPCDSPQEEVHPGGAPSQGFSWDSHIISCPRTTQNQTMYGVEYWEKTKIPDSVDVQLALDPHPNSTRDQSFARFYAGAVNDQMQQQMGDKGLKGTTNDIPDKDGFAGSELHITSPSGNRIDQRIWVKLPRCITLSVINAEMGIDAENKAFLDSLAVH